MNKHELARDLLVRYKRLLAFRPNIRRYLQIVSTTELVLCRLLPEHLHEYAVAFEKHDEEYHLAIMHLLAKLFEEKPRRRLLLRKLDAAFVEENRMLGYLREPVRPTRAA